MAKMIGYKVYSCGHGKDCCRNIDLNSRREKRMEKKAIKAREKRIWKKEN
jgi:hypothetical protein